MAIFARPAWSAWPNPARVHRIDLAVFGRTEARVADCIARYESNDGWRVVNGTQLGIFQINWPWHIAITGSSRRALRRLAEDWLWNAKVAKRIAWHPPSRGRPGYWDWRPWSTAYLCT